LFKKRSFEENELVRKDILNKMQKPWQGNFQIVNLSKNNVKWPHFGLVGVSFSGFAGKLKRLVLSCGGGRRGERGAQARVDSGLS
jgi:hypothetical protein